MTRIFTLFLVMLTSVLSLSAQTCSEKPFYYVVMGSSTAYGNGAVPIADSSFANIFKKYVKAKNSASEVYNIAIGATNTYHANPTWYLPPAGRPLPNTAMNITRAINEFKPDGIIISFPSNDAVERYTLDEQKANFERIVAVADSFNVQVWVTSTQPRNESLDVRKDLVTLRDWLATRFGSRYIDCWTTLAAGDGFIAADYAYGDGIHVNNKGHRLIAERVIAKDMNSVICNISRPTFSISASMVNNKGRVWWSTQKELFVLRHVVERNTSGNTWDSAGMVVAKGGASSNYTFTDPLNLTVKTKYRIKTVDIHGRQTYSDTVEVTGKQPFTLTSFTGYADKNIHRISWTTSSETDVTSFIVIRNEGEVWTAQGEVTTGGNSSGVKNYSVDVPYYSTGTIVYQLLARDSRDNQYYTDSIAIKADSLYWEPFRLKSISAERPEDNGFLQWTTTSERRTMEFRIMMRKAAGGDWSKIGTVPSSGNSDTAKSYIYFMRDYYQEDLFLRLDMVDSLNRVFNSPEVLLKYKKGSYQLGELTVKQNVNRLRELNWYTLYESSLKEFVIQKNLVPGGDQWTNIKTVPSAGYSNNLALYTYVDPVAIASEPWSSYRLRMEDTEGNIKYSGYTSIAINADTARIAIDTMITEYLPNANYIEIRWLTRKETLHHPTYFSLFRSIDNGVTWDSLTEYIASYDNVAAGQKVYRVVEYKMFDMDVKYQVRGYTPLENDMVVKETTLPKGAAPTHLKSFSGVGDFGTSVLKWQSGKETRAAKMLVRRSIDQQQWDIVAVLRAVGNSTTPQDYEYIDRRVPQMTLYYRVEMDDTLGRHIEGWPITVTPDTMYAQPFRMGTFTGVADANQQILHWETKAEKNTLRFVLDRSSDSSNWAYGVDTIAAAGVGATLQGKKYDATYTYNISTATNTVYYRLRMQDTLARNFTAGVVKIAADTNFANPFRLASFAASRGLTNQTLTWSTVKEWNSEYFRIERYIGTSGWLAVDSVKAAGMSSALKNYTFTDTGYSEKDINYRLVMTDKYGRSFISPSSLLTADTNYTKFYRLGTFTAQRDGDKQTIRWETTKEWNTVKFAIERNNDNAWIRIDSVNAAGMAMQGKAYVYTDTAYSPKETYYRLVVSDKYNRSERSGEAFVRIDSNYVTSFRLTNYTAKRDLDKQVVSWTTTKEFRLKNFLVERNNGTGWLPVDSFAATNAATGSVYTYTDKQYAEKETYYRIEVRDQFGRATRQGEVFVRVDSNYITPIRLASFTAVRSNSDRVVNWASAKEFRSKQFKLERKGAAGTWDSVYAVAGAGIAMTGKAYAYTDTAFLSEALTYRLVMTDISNQVFTSAEVKVVADTDYITPYRIVNFAVKQDKDKQVISWTSVKEWNIVGYEIERHVLPATGGREMEEGWQVIASIKATGVEAGAKNYSYTDTQTQEKQVAYRVVVLDKFGRDFTTPSVSLTPNLGYKNAFNLTAFSVTRQSGNRVLQWRTDSENGAAYFEIERSTDSATWKKIETINATGTSAVAKDYNFTDASATTTVWVYYRLRMVDAKGAITFSNAVKILALITAIPDAPQLPDGKVIVYPNPAATEIRIAGYGRNVHTEIFNAQGQRVYLNTQYNGGEIKVSAWPAGMYFILLEKGKYRLHLIKL